ncbi:BON domain-containing protein [Haloechinothrix salitolerans]|uniref:BON domain-containing protein n=1 Tax=Haloechinothrix salitolerans TaxID=926830 RepID=A0ABW2C2F2_9PSEU
MAHEHATEYAAQHDVAPHDRAARLRRALAEDPRTSELGVAISVRGDRVRLTGTVASAARKTEVDVVAQEAEPGLHVTNDITVVSAAEPGEAEDIE